MEARMPLIRTSSSKLQVKKQSLNRRHSEKLKNTSQIAPAEEELAGGSTKNEIMIAHLLKSAGEPTSTKSSSPTRFEEVKILIDDAGEQKKKALPLFDMEAAAAEMDIDLDNLNFINVDQSAESGEPTGALNAAAPGASAVAHKVSFKKNKTAARQLSNKYSNHSLVGKESSSSSSKLISTSDASSVSPSSSVSSVSTAGGGADSAGTCTSSSASASASSSPLASKSAQPPPAPVHHHHHVHRHKHGHKFYRRHEAEESPQQHQHHLDESVDDPDSISIPMGLPSLSAAMHQFQTSTSTGVKHGPREISIILPPNYDDDDAKAKVITLSRDLTLKSSTSSLLGGQQAPTLRNSSSSNSSTDKAKEKQQTLKRSHSDFIKTIKLPDNDNLEAGGDEDGGAADKSKDDTCLKTPVARGSGKMNNELATSDMYKSELVEKNNELFNQIIESLKTKNKQLINSQLVSNALIHKSTPNLAPNLDFTKHHEADLVTAMKGGDAVVVGASNVAGAACANFSSSLELTTNIFDLQKKLKQNLINSSSNLNLNRIQLLNNNYFNNSYSYYNDLFTVSYINSNQSNNRAKFAQRYKLIAEGDVHVCKLPNTRNVISKILNSKLLRRWKPHRLVLTDSEIFSTTKTDYMETDIPFMAVNEVSAISKWEPGQKYCLRVATFECHYLIQTNNAYLRDQWLHSIIWKKHKFKSERLLRSAERHDVIIKEIKHLIDMSMATPIDDNEVYQHPLELISEVLQKHSFPKQAHEAIIVTLSPLLEKNHPSPEICDFFSRHCRDSPRSHIVIEMFTPVVQRILKHNGDFGRYPRMRLFIQDYLMALISQNAGLQTVQKFVRTMHSPSSQCPFPRVLPNFVSVCLAAIHSCYEQRRNHKNTQQPIVHLTEEEIDNILTCYTTMMYTMSTFEDWRVNLAQLLQSVPFPDQAQTNQKFINIFKNVAKNFAEDTRCEVHQTLLGIREGKEGWFEIFCPGGISCNDDGELFTVMLKTLIGCCCKKKRFLLSINKMLAQLMVLAAKEVPCAIETLCAMLDLNGVENADNKLQIVSALQSTELGLKQYAKVCERQMQLKELQQKGGPRKLTLPSRSTDEDLAKLLMSGSFGNLECLSLAFTNVTSACAEYLIKLPSLRYLNLWSTKFGDQGLELISEHLLRLQVLNLCETPVTDKGLACLASMKQLRKLNLNSTNLSALTFEGLKECLPALQECDIRYTDAW